VGVRFPWSRVGLGLILFLGFLAVLLGSSPLVAQTLSNYAIAQQSEFNRPGYYPLKQQLNPQYYQPVSEWQGRLILPPAEASPNLADWVWLELWHAPTSAQAWVGKTLRLEWAPDPQLQASVQAVSRDVQFSEVARTSQAQGNIYPSRLNGRQRVGPLQSLAGAHPLDDVIVSLEAVTLKPGTTPTLQIQQEPIQVTGRYYTLVQVLGPVNHQANHYWVQHYNRLTRRFDGDQEMILIPQVLPDRDQVWRSTPQNLLRSAAGNMGWYLYGGQNQAGRFVAQAIQPRSLLALQPQESRQGEWQGLNYLKQQQWYHTHRQKGKFAVVQLDPTQPNPWRLGDQALVLHLFGGIGGQKAEPNPIWGTITGHFSFGWARVVREPLADELQFQLEYQQVYAHNPDGIIAGRLSWPAYMGDLQRGWLGTRPVSDILVKIPAILEDYQFPGLHVPGLHLSPLSELQRQLQLMTARYRIGNGTGATLVNPAQSCVQDSSQSVFITIARLEEHIKANPEVQAWLANNSDAPEAQRFQQLVQLHHSLERQLTPFWLRRADWQQNAESVAGVAPATATEPSFLDQILSWRTVFPRVAHDQLATTFLKQGASLRVLRTNQVGGWDPTILPLAPTQLLDASGLPYLFSRLIESMIAIPGWQELGIMLIALLSYGCMALWWGQCRSFLSWRPAFENRHDYLKLGLHTLFAPGLIEEILFRVFPLPHPAEAVVSGTWLAWAVLSLGLFILYHPLNALTFYPAGRPTFMQAPFLILATGLGLVCTGVYALTGSLWCIALIHWLVVFVWLGWLGGMARLEHPKSPQSAP
jgi:predicted Abi (CAAX) family protease